MSNYGKLRGKIRELGLTCADVADEIGISATSFSNKLLGKTDFSQTEMKRLAEVLGIEATEMADYFFCA
jgi:cyanate lyase